MRIIDNETVPNEWEKDVPARVRALAGTSFSLSFGTFSL